MNTVGVKRGFWAAAICLMFISSMAAAAYRESQPAMPSDQPSKTSPMMHGRTGTLQCADKALGSSVYNSQNEKIGTIKDLIIDKNLNAVSYVILSSGTNYYPVPWKALGTIDKGFTLDVTRDSLHGAPMIKSDDPKLLNEELTKSVNSFYSKQISMSRELSGQTMSGMAKSVKEKFSSESPTFLSCRETLGLAVKNSQDKRIGAIKDIVFDVRQGNVVYGLTSFGGFMGIARKTAVVPWSAFLIEPDKKIARLDADERKLASVELPRDQFAKLSDPTFTRQVSNTFGNEPYSEVYGYVPPTEGRRGAVAAGTFATGAWALGSEYNKSFRPEALTTIEGTIKSVTTFTPEIGAERGTELKIETADNETETIHLGPQTWIDNQNVKFVEGDRITVTGSKVRHGLGKVIMASEIKKGDQTLRLRDESGKPLWISSGSEMKRGKMSEEPKTPSPDTSGEVTY